MLRQKSQLSCTSVQIFQYMYTCYLDKRALVFSLIFTYYVIQMKLTHTHTYIKNCKQIYDIRILKIKVDFKIRFNRYPNILDHLPKPLNLTPIKSNQLNSEYLNGNFFCLFFFLEKKYDLAKAPNANRKMGKILKPGRVVLILGGRYTGRKAVVVKVNFYLNLYIVYVFIFLLFDMS